MPQHPNPTILETERLLLCYQRDSDIEPLIALWMDPEAMRFMGGPRDRGKLDVAFAEVAQDPFAETYDLWTLIEKASGRVAGHCGLLEKEVDGQAEIELIYVLAPSMWGQGYATEIALGLKQYAFETLGLTRLIALIEPENAASERVAVKTGFSLEKEVIRPGGALRKVYAVKQSSPVRT